MQYSKIAYQEFEKIRYIPEIEAVRFDFADLNASNEFKVPLDTGQIVLGVGLEIMTAWASGGSTPTVTVGDADTANGYLASGDVAPETIGAFAFSAGLGTNTFAKGKKYNAANYVKVTLSLDADVGEAILYIQTLRVDGNWRVPAV